jgi:FMN phosphatase YigB (HAD superfamily)
MLKFLYFDLGNVLLNFDHQRGCRQMGEVAGVPAERVWEVFFETEEGELTDQEVHEFFCRETGTRPDRQRLLAAAGDIFETNESIVPLVDSLKRAGHRLGILSNTCSAHWDHCAGGRYPFLCQAFEVHALSYRIRALKPDARIYEAARQLAGVAAHEIFFVDDIEKNVAGARQAGFDAVRYTTTPELIAELQNRGITV